MKNTVAEKLLRMTQDSYALISDKFDKTRRNCWDDFTFFDSFVKEGMTVLDVGCGNGRLFKYLMQKRAIHYVGIDQNPKFIEIARREYSSHETDPQFYTASILEPESCRVFESRQFDVVFCIAALHHIPTKKLQEQAVAAFKRYLRPGGMLCMENWNMWELRKGKKNVWHALARRLNDTLFFRGSTDQAVGPLTAHENTELGWRDLVTEWGGGGTTVRNRPIPDSCGDSGCRGFLYYHAFTMSELRKLLGTSGFTTLHEFYIRDGKPAHWWNGKNIITIAKKRIL